jgi:hypothetical protein
MRAIGRRGWLAIVAFALACRPATSVEMAPSDAEMTHATIPLQLDASLESGDVRVQIENPCDEPVRVWDLGNSWGGDSWSLRVRVDGSEGRTFVLRPSNAIYTRNVPRFIEVPAKGRHEIRLTPSAREWTAGEDLSALRDANLLVQVVLEIADSPEAEQNQVATGRVTSTEVPSNPPHGWLFVP